MTLRVRASWSIDRFAAPISPNPGRPWLRGAPRQNAGGPIPIPGGQPGGRGCRPDVGCTDVSAKHIDRDVDCSRGTEHVAWPTDGRGCGASLWVWVWPACALCTASPIAANECCASPRATRSYCHMVPPCMTASAEPRRGYRSNRFPRIAGGAMAPKARLLSEIWPMAGNTYSNICSCSSFGWEYVNVLAEKNTETPPKKNLFSRDPCTLNGAFVSYAGQSFGMPVIFALAPVRQSV
jgi:hypothetical protein